MEIIFFVIAGFIALFTVFLGISNWVFISSISTKISGLEDEIEKKTLEIDAFKKEKTSGGGQHIRNYQQSTEKAQDTGYAETADQEIKIVRNVRGGGFENYETDAGNYSSPAQAVVVPAQTPGVSPEGEVEQEHLDQQPDVLDVIDETSRSDAITLCIFSIAKKDTDFTTAWKQLAQILTNRKKPRINIDFSNVMFLYDRELLYLEKFRDVILRSGGTVSFVNCEAELAAILRKNPLLAGHVTANGHS